MAMNRLYVERRQVGSLRIMARDIVNHLYAHRVNSRALVITDQPSDLMGSVTRHWRKLERRVRRERSSTLIIERQQVFDQEISYIGRLKFSTKPMLASTEAAVIFAHSEYDIDLLLSYETLYGAIVLDKERLDKLAELMPESGLIVLYE